MKINADLHLHSKYSAACSKNITIPELSKEGVKKGLDLLSTADILHPEWRKHVRENLIEKDGCYRYKHLINQKKIYYILGTEVETKNRIHHLLFFKDFKNIQNFYENIKNHTQNLDNYGSGRTKLSLTSKELLDICIKNQVIIGPAHIFTPYFGIYAHYDSLEQAYGENWKYIKFIELGLSADTHTANIIPELKDLFFFSFSDSHSQKSFRIGREYVCLDMERPNFLSLKHLLERKKGKLLYNVGYDPREGKYHKTACRKCFTFYKLQDAISLNFKCALCKSTIKKGVEDRAFEVSILQGNKDLKPLKKEGVDYKYLMPLAQVIGLAIKRNNILHKEVQLIYEEFIKNHTEIEVMQGVEPKELEKINPLIAKYIMAFREKKVMFRPGGAGRYGEPFIFFDEKQALSKQKEINSLYFKNTQKKLF